MSMKRILCLVLALLMCSAIAFAEETDLDAANARIAELEAQVALYKPFYDAQIVVEYDGGVVMRTDAMTEYEYTVSMYSQYGIDVAAYGLTDLLKQEAVNVVLEQAVLELKAIELGFDQFDEETEAELRATAEANHESYVNSVLSYFSGDGITEEQALADATSYVDSMGYTVDAIYDGIKHSHMVEQLYAYATADVTVTDEDVQAAYDEMVASAQTSYANDYTYNNDRNGGAMILWNPEGYRQVKHVLIQFSDEQSALYGELTSTLDSLNTELEAILNPVEPAEGEEPAELRAEADVRADIAAIEAEIDALYAELLPTAEEVVSKFEAGTPFADLIAEYNTDPGMANEPTATLGYAVSATSTAWDPAFTEGAMSIEAVGGISAPVYGSYGIHIIYYEADIVAGPVDIETVRAELETIALENLTATAYETAVAEWVDAVNPVYHYENMA